MKVGGQFLVRPLCPEGERYKKNSLIKNQPKNNRNQLNYM
jgi:hypothetical protein